MRAFIMTIYRSDPRKIALLAAAAVLLWILLYLLLPKYMRRIGWVLFAASCVGILGATLWGRTPKETAEIYLLPFSKLIRAGQQPELYRELFMNILLYLPFGLTLPCLLPAASSCRRRILTVFLTALSVSLGIEILQALFRIGLFETDDIAANTGGALIGALAAALPILLAALLKKRKKKNQKKE